MRTRGQTRQTRRHKAGGAQTLYSVAARENGRRASRQALPRRAWELSSGAADYAGSGAKQDQKHGISVMAPTLRVGPAMRTLCVQHTQTWTRARTITPLCHSLRDWRGGALRSNRQGSRPSFHRTNKKAPAFAKVLRCLIERDYSAPSASPSAGPASGRRRCAPTLLRQLCWLRSNR